MHSTNSSHKCMFESVAEKILRFLRAVCDFAEQEKYEHHPSRVAPFELSNL